MFYHTRNFNALLLNIQWVNSRMNLYVFRENLPILYISFQKNINSQLNKNKFIGWKRVDIYGFGQFFCFFELVSEVELGSNS